MFNKSFTLAAAALTIASMYLQGCEESDRDVDDTVDASGDTDTDSDSDTDSDADSDSDSDADSDSDSDVDSDSDSDGDTDTSDECDGLELIYVVDKNNLFYTFDPGQSTVQTAFVQVGTGPLTCPSGGNPFSMSVGRDGFAYVLFVNNLLVGFDCVGVNRIDIETGACEGLIPFTCGSNSKFPETFGMGYVTDGSDTTDETLYVGASGQSGEAQALGYLDVISGALTSVASALPKSGPEFTGNQLGELWGFFPQASPPLVAEIDKITGGLADPVNHYFELKDFAGMPESWAFAYWGDGFYIFYKKSLDPATVVYRLEMDGSIRVHLDQTGLNIVGAGVSTCAPIIIE